MAFETVFAKMKINTDIKIEVISAGWGWDPVREGHTRDFWEKWLIMTYFITWMVSTGFPLSYYYF